MYDAVECDIVVAGYRNTLCNCVVTTKIFLQNEVAVRETKMLKWNSGKQIEKFTQILRQSDRNDARRPCERQRTRINNDAKKASFPTTYRDWRIQQQKLAKLLAKEMYACTFVNCMKWTAKNNESRKKNIQNEKSGKR